MMNDQLWTIDDWWLMMINDELLRLPLIIQWLVVEIKWNYYLLWWLQYAIFNLLVEYLQY